jgi:hypothetical protein
MIKQMDIPPDWKAATERAMQAALQGRWEEVREYYAFRESWLRSPRIPAETAVSLAATDREIEAMILVARAVTGALLEEASSTRRAVGQLRTTFDRGARSHSRVSRRI